MLATVAGSPSLVLLEREDDASICSLAPVEDPEEVCGDRRHRTDCAVRLAAEGQPAVAVALILVVIIATATTTASVGTHELRAAAVKDSKNPGPVPLA